MGGVDWGELGDSGIARIRNLGDWGDSGIGIFRE